MTRNQLWCINHYIVPVFQFCNKDQKFVLMSGNISVSTEISTNPRYFFSIVHYTSNYSSTLLPGNTVHSNLTHRAFASN